MHYFSNLFDKVLYMFRTGPLSIIRSISTMYTQQEVFVMLVLLASASTLSNKFEKLCISLVFIIRMLKQSMPPFQIPEDPS